MIFVQQKSLKRTFEYLSIKSPLKLAVNSRRLFFCSKKAGVKWS